MRRYGNRVVFGPFSLVYADELLAVESEIGRRLPDAYRAFIDVANGGRLEYVMRMPHGAGGEAIGFPDLHVLGRDAGGRHGFGTVLGEYRRRTDAWFARDIPVDTLLPIAGNGTGDMLLIDLDPRTLGRIVAAVHGLPSWAGPNQADEVAVIADSLDGYLDALVIDDDIAGSTWADLDGVAAADPWRRAVEAWLDADLPRWRERPWAARP